ncbi:MAG: CYTH domain-containing protein [Flavobacteriales bacterium]|nr:CYTH domain-containing protein [Flavobacteriales bacterium]
MPIEIERKYLVHKHLLPKLEVFQYHSIIQGYLSSDPNLTIRIRLKNNKAFLTFKGKTTGISRTEIEIPVDVSVADELISSFELKTLVKKRYLIPFEEILIELDVFEGPLQGLILAEIELKSEGQEIVLPDWIADDVSDREEYYNSNLINS